MSKSISTAQTTAQITSANQQNSPLLRLPGELRNQIWVYALGGQRIRLSLRGDKILVLYRDKTAPAFELLKVCTQIIAEARMLLYSLNVFDLVATTMINDLANGMTTSSIEAIKTLEFPLCFIDTHYPRVASSLAKFKGLEQIRLKHSCRDNHSRLPRYRDGLRVLADGLRNDVPGVKILTYKFIPREPDWAVRIALMRHSGLSSEKSFTETLRTERQEEAEEQEASVFSRHATGSLMSTEKGKGARAP